MIKKCLIRFFLVSEEPDVSITGNKNVIYGDSAVFEAKVTSADPSCWSLIWQKIREPVTECIDINRDKYSGSTNRKLVITSVSREDEWRYQAVLSRNTNGNKQKILSNEIFLQALGGIFYFRVRNYLCNKIIILMILKQEDLFCRTTKF